MNWVDFNIICVGAYSPKIFKNSVYDIEAMNGDSRKTIKCYIEGWDILNRIQGIWYELWSSDKKYDYLINSTWELQDVKKSEDNISHGYQLFIDKTCKDILYDILYFYINASPIKKIIVLFRHQGHESDNLHSYLSLDCFLEKLIKKEIYGNVAYIIGCA